MTDRTQTLTLASTLLLLFIISGCAAPASSEEYKQLREGFRNPPDQARPDAFWPWLNGNADRARITLEMEEARAAVSCS